MTNTPEGLRPHRSLPLALGRVGMYQGSRGSDGPPDHLPNCPLLGLRKSNSHSSLSGLLAADSGQWVGVSRKGKRGPRWNPRFAPRVWKWGAKDVAWRMVKALNARSV